MKTLFLSALTACFAILFSMAPAFAQKGNPDAILGVWETEETKAHIEIYKDGKEYFGKIVKLQEPKNADGSEKLDKENPDAKLKKRPIMGLKNLNNFEYAGDNVWEDGTIYNPKDGKTYKCIMTLKDKNTLDVRGYVGISMFGKTQTFRRIK